MIDWASVPVFGVRTPGAQCVVRPSAYGLIADGCDRLALVRTPSGVFLPGGGIEGAESVELAIRRESIEECGLFVRVLDWQAHAMQFVVSEAQNREFEKHCSFRAAALEPGRGRSSEVDHALFWGTASEALRLLAHGSQRWAVERWCEHAGRALRE